MSHEKLAAAIRMTIDDIDEELGAADPLFRLGNIRELDFIETAAAASVLQGFYTGIENLILYLCKTIDGSIPQSSSWHKELLEQASSPTAKRPAIIDIPTRDLLVTFLNFRHAVRHGYVRHLRADRTRDLLLAAPAA